MCLFWAKSSKKKEKFINAILFLLFIVLLKVVMKRKSAVITSGESCRKSKIKKMSTTPCLNGGEEGDCIDGEQSHSSPPATAKGSFPLPVFSDGLVPLKVIIQRLCACAYSDLVEIVETYIPNHALIWAQAGGQSHRSGKKRASVALDYVASKTIRKGFLVTTLG